MSKNTTTPEFEIGDEVLIFADRQGFYSAEESDTPSLREVTIEAAPDEDGDYRIRHSALGWRYARAERIFPLGTILVDGKPVRPEDQDVNRELPEGHSLHSDGGMFFVGASNTLPPACAEEVYDPALGWTSIGYVNPDNLFLERHYDWRDCGCKRVCEQPTGKSYTTTFTIEEMSPEAKELFFGGAEVSDPYQEFLNEVASTLDDRGVDYGGVEDNFEDIAAMWSAIAGTEIRADQVGLMMIALKLVRANKTNKRDNLLDIAGYAAHVAKIQEDQLGKA